MRKKKDEYFASLADMDCLWHAAAFALPSNVLKPITKQFIVARTIDIGKTLPTDAMVGFYDYLARMVSLVPARSSQPTSTPETYELYALLRFNNLN